MAPDVLLHLIEPAAWRAALTDGAVRPPSLDVAGLRAPVHARAGAPAGGAALPGPARPGAAGRRPGPADRPGAVRARRAGGPRRAAVPAPLRAAAGDRRAAVVPYRPPAPVSLPAPRRPARPGAGVLHVGAHPPGRGGGRRPGRGRGARPRPRALPRQQPPAAHRPAWTPRRSRAPPRRSAATRVGRTGRRRCCGRAPATSPPSSARRGWNTEELLLMARPAAPDRRAATASRSVDQREVHEFWERSWRRDLPDRPGPGPGDRRPDRPGAPQRPGRGGDRPGGARGRPGGRLRPAPGRRRDGGRGLRADRPGRPRAGHADAILARALDLAADAGCDLVVLEAAADDWPRHWYARRGFEVVGSCGPPTAAPDVLDRARAPTAAGRPARPRAAASPAGPSARRGRGAGSPCP